MMIESNCPICNRRRKFNATKENKYKCDSCQTAFKRCKNKECDNMTKIGLICKECVGKGMKNGGAVALTGVGAVGALAAKTLLKKGK
ncbi:hypothetical protein QMA09_12860 [Planococcus sp. APC 3906]|uniref:hypothetical protein n=1 Tax=Planococcus sp. APC 3906 TaxID=3035194 RepID=UPI0025B32660|nr:hypothetical protein [Planococcus sp. APC 3906]MDN3451082.1 hypothetical protein [Planococcus sp. APC 3906]